MDQNHKEEGADHCGADHCGAGPAIGVTASGLHLVSRLVVTRHGSGAGDHTLKGNFRKLIHQKEVQDGGGKKLIEGCPCAEGQNSV